MENARSGLQDLGRTANGMLDSIAHLAPVIQSAKDWSEFGSGQP